MITDILNQMITVDHILMILGGMIVGWMISSIMKKKKYRESSERLLEKLDERDEWIKMLKEQTPS